MRLPFIVTCVGAFTRGTQLSTPGDSSTPKTPSAACSAVAPHLSAALLVSVEEGLVRSIAVDAVGLGRNVLHGQTLARNAGIGRVYNQTLLRMSRHVERDPTGATPAILIAHRSPHNSDPPRTPPR